MTATNAAEGPRARGADFDHRTVLVRRWGYSTRWHLRSATVCVAAAVLALGLTMWSLTLGDYPLSLVEVWNALLGASDEFSRMVVVDWRMPRSLAAAVFGAALGASGAVFQSMTRNPLASPDIIGFSTGSFTGALAVIILVQGTYVQVAGGAIIGGLATALVIYLLAWRDGAEGFRMIIVGIAVTAMLASLNTWLILSAKLEVAMSAAAWGAGSLNGTTWEQSAFGSIVIVSFLVWLSTLAPGLRQLELGDDAARATGTRAEATRLGALVVGVGLTATVTAAAGPIAFVALAAPQIARRLARTPGVTIAPAACLGALLLVCADLVAGHVLPEALPVGVVTVVLGGAYLVWLIVREVRRRA